MGNLMSLFHFFICKPNPLTILEVTNKWNATPFNKEETSCSPMNPFKNNNLGLHLILSAFASMPL